MQYKITRVGCNVLRRIGTWHASIKYPFQASKALWNRTGNICLQISRVQFDPLDNAFLFDSLSCIFTLSNTLSNKSLQLFFNQVGICCSYPRDGETRAEIAGMCNYLGQWATQGFLLSCCRLGQHPSPYAQLTKTPYVG